MPFPASLGWLKTAAANYIFCLLIIQAEAVRGLENFSHLWVLFVFHQTMEGGWRPTVRPPASAATRGWVFFATRSTFRPNPIGMSLVELKGIHCQKERVVLELGSLDLVDGTPVVDIKPYLPFAEALPEASASYAQQAPQAEVAVSFTPETEAQLFALKTAIPALRRLLAKFWHKIRGRHIVKKKTGKDHAVWLLDFNVRWRVISSGFEVFSLEPR